jgi:uncharacterized protein
MPAIIDTGPLVAFLDRAERHHAWVVARLEELEAPLLICELVLTEAMYLLGRCSQAQGALFELLENGALSIAFRVDENASALRNLLQKISGHTNVTRRRVCRSHGRDTRSP